MLLIIATTLFGQQTKPTPKLTKQDYLQKSKKQKTAAWLLLGGGTVLAVSGAVISANETANDIGDIFLGRYEEGGDAGVVLFIAGFASMAGSIPFFIASGRNKNKAINLSFKMQRVPQLQKGSLINESIRSLSIKISL